MPVLPISCSKLNIWRRFFKILRRRASACLLEALKYNNTFLIHKGKGAKMQPAIDTKNQIF